MTGGPVNLNSSNLGSAEYNEQTGALTITFQDGRVYEYNGVDADTYSTLASAASPGSFFQRSIRGRFSYTRIR